VKHLGGSKPKKAKTTQAVSGFDNITGADYSGPFGSGQSTIGNGRIGTTVTLAPGLQTASDTAQTGLNQNLAYLQMDPNQRYDFLSAGKDPLYNLVQDQSGRTTDYNLGRARLSAYGTGNQNSTAGGAAIGSVLNDDILRQNTNLLNAFNYNNQLATSGAQTNLGALGGIANLVYPLGAAANSNLMQARSDISGVNLANAQAQNQAERDYINQLNQQAAQSRSGMASGIGSLLGAGLGAALAIPTGGLSLAGGAMLGSSLGGSAGGMFGGSGQSSAPYSFDTTPKLY
jgi:hypothetical protein